MNNEAEIITEEEVSEVVETNEDTNESEELEVPTNEESKSEVEETNENETEESEEEKEEDSEEVVVTIGDEESPPQEDKQPAPTWVKELRKNNRELKKKIKELEQEKNQYQSIENKPVELGKKPVIEDFDYDSEAYDKELESWYERKIQVEKQNSKLEEEKKIQEKQFQERLDTYNKSKDDLKVSDFDEAQFNVEESIDLQRQGFLLKYTKNPALVVYALGKNPKKLEEFSKIKDPGDFISSIAVLETQLKVSNRKRPSVKPEKKIQSRGTGATSHDDTLERLREEAAKTGNITKVRQYRDQRRKVNG